MALKALRLREKWVFFLIVSFLVGTIAFAYPKALRASAKPASSKTAKKTGSSISETEKKESFFLDEYKDPAKAKPQKSAFASFFNSVFAVLKYLFYFVLVLALGYCAIWGIKFVMAKNNSYGGANELINILDLRYLAPNKAICLVEVGERILLVGLGGNSIDVLSELDDPDQVEDLRAKARRKGEALQPFQNYLNTFVEKFLACENNPPSEQIKDNLKTTTDSIHKKIVSLSELRKSRNLPQKTAFSEKERKNCSCPKCRIERVIKGR